MAILIATVLTAVLLAIVAYPVLVQRGRRAAEADEPLAEAIEQLRRARDRTYEEIRALQQERFMRDISDQEYQAQLEALRAQAARLIQQQRDMQAGLPPTGERADANPEHHTPQGADG